MPATINDLPVTVLTVEQILTTSTMDGCRGVVLVTGDVAEILLSAWVDQQPFVYVGPISDGGVKRDATINIKLNEFALRDDGQVAVRFSNRGAVMPAAPPS